MDDPFLREGRPPCPGPQTSSVRGRFLESAWAGLHHAERVGPGFSFGMPSRHANADRKGGGHFRPSADELITLKTSSFFRSVCPKAQTVLLCSLALVEFHPL